jgi:hypothetical protein
MTAARLLLPINHDHLMRLNLGSLNIANFIYYSVSSIHLCYFLIT